MTYEEAIEYFSSMGRSDPEAVIAIESEVRAIRQAHAVVTSAHKALLCKHANLKSTLVCVRELPERWVEKPWKRSAKCADELVAALNRVSLPKTPAASRE